MKIIKNNMKLVIGIVLGIIISGTTAYATGLFDSSDVSFDNTTAGLKKVGTNVDVDNVQDAVEAIDNKVNTELSICQASLPQTPFKLGDYFSLTPTKTTFTIKAATTGYTSDQTITPNELTLWRVIDIHSDGSVDAVSEYVSSEEVWFRGITGYANYVGGLQTIAASYAKEGYTIGTRMMGYGGQTATIQDTSAFNGSTNNAPGTTTTSSPTTGTGQEYGEGVLGDTLYLKDYTLVSNVYKTDTTTYGSNGLIAYIVTDTTTASLYWLASRRYNYSSAANFNFYGRYVQTDGSLSYYRFRYFSNSWSDNGTTRALRPIITLKSGVTKTGGSGTKASPYTIN